MSDLGNLVWPYTARESNEGSYPPPFARTTVKALEMTEPTPPFCSDEGVVDLHGEKTPAAKQCIIEAQTTMSMEVHRRAKCGRPVISIPKIPSPAPGKTLSSQTFAFQTSGSVVGWATNTPLKRKQRSRDRSHLSC